MNVLKLVLALVIATLLVVLGAQNTDSVSFRVLAWDTPAVPVVLALALAVLAGVLLSSLVSIPGRVRGMRERRDLRRQVGAQGEIPRTEEAASPREGENTDRHAD